MKRIDPPLSAAVFLLLAGCCTLGGQPAPPADPPRCSPSGPPNGKKALSTSCNLVVQTTQYCTYDEAGRLKDISSEPSGACFCLNF